MGGHGGWGDMGHGVRGGRIRTWWSFRELSRVKNILSARFSDHFKRTEKAYYSCKTMFSTFLTGESLTRVWRRWAQSPLLTLSTYVSPKSGLVETLGGNKLPAAQPWEQSSPNTGVQQAGLGEAQATTSCGPGLALRPPVLTQFLSKV